jgi:signal peptidase II
MKRSRNLFIILLLTGTLFVDQLSKYFAVRHLRGRLPMSYFGDSFIFEYVENPGAFLSLGAGLEASSRFWIFTCFVAAVLCFVLYWIFSKTQMHRLETAALTLLVGGGIGNLIDRLYRGRVVDFMNLGVGSLRTGVFNVADMAIVVGAVILIYQSFQKQPVTAPK